MASMPKLQSPQRPAGPEVNSVAPFLSLEFPLHAAVRASAAASVLESLVSRSPEALKKPDDTGRLPIFYAIHPPDAAELEKERLAEAKKPLGDGVAAAGRDSVEAVRILVAHDPTLTTCKCVDPYTSDPFICDPLPFFLDACYQGAGSVVDFLLQHDPDLRRCQGHWEGNYADWRSSSGENGGHWMPLATAALANQVHIVEKLLALDPELARASGAKTARPIAFAIAGGSVECFEVLLAAAPELANEIAWEDKTHLHIAVEIITFFPDRRARYEAIINRLLALDPAFAAARNTFMRGLRPVDFGRQQLTCAATLRLLSIIDDAARIGMFMCIADFEMLITDLCRLPEGLSAALATAFTASPLQTVHIVAHLVPQCMLMAKLAARTDEALSERIIETCQRMQQATIIAIEERVLHLFSTPHGIRALDALVVGQCKLVLGRPKLQRLLQQMWSPSRLWLSHRATRGGHAFDLARSICGIALSVGLLPVFALWPPLEDRVQRWAAHRRACVETRVESSGGGGDQPGNWAPFGQGFNDFGHIDGKVYTTREQYDAALEPYLTAVDPRAWLPLVEPAGKFMFAATCRLLLAVRIGLYPVGVQDAPWMLVWVAAFVLDEATENLRGFMLWLAEPLNVMEMVAYLLFLGGMLHCLVVRADVCLDADTAMVFSTGTALLTLSQGLRILYRVPGLGPLTLMILQMVSDVVQIVVLYCPIVAAFSLAFYVLFRIQEAEPEPTSGIDQEACEIFEYGGQSGRLLSALGIGVQLWEIMLGSENLLSCLHVSAFPTLGPLLMNLYILLASVLLMNMLIAMMAKSFDTIWEKTALNYQFLTAKVILSYHHATLAPPPLNLLSLPYYTISALMRVLAQAGSKKQGVRNGAGASASAVLPNPEPGLLVKVKIEDGKVATWHQCRDDAARRGGRLATADELRAAAVQAAAPSEGQAQKHHWVPVTATTTLSTFSGYEEERRTDVPGENCWAAIGEHRYAVMYPAWGLEEGEAGFERARFFYMVLEGNTSVYAARMAHEGLGDRAANAEFFDSYLSGVQDLARAMDDFIMENQAEAAQQEDSYKKAVLKDTKALGTAVSALDAKLDRLAAKLEQHLGDSRAPAA